MTEILRAPTMDCPKCGVTRAFEFKHPLYQYLGDADWLEWVCRRCEYRISTQTLDAKKIDVKDSDSR